MIHVSIAEDTQGSEWDEYVNQHTFHHHAHGWGWRTAIREAFGHTPYYLIARASDDSAICGVLPLYHFKSVLFGKALISMPYLNAGAR